ncbi:LpxA family transferase [Archangium minus]|uniref:LpxA family transferase n=1 Tax=Archangium minus TaxID=83450 RepID=A0ABY9WLQ9_9BACT|nr:LpxA family transferase [Archangium minus]
MYLLTNYVPHLREEFPLLPLDAAPWNIVAKLPLALPQFLQQLDLKDYEDRAGVYIHRSARVEDGAILKGPALIREGCFIAAHAYLRGGVILGPQVTVGPGCELKTSIISSKSVLAHFNFVGDSIIGRGVNLEAGAVVANHWNERTDKTIRVHINGQKISTGCTKFGALIGDGARIGANAVLSPGTLLPPGAVVRRLQLVEQDGAEPE